jgi:hypothetical protein
VRHGVAILGVTAMLVAGVYLRADTPGQDPAAPVHVGGNIQAPKKIKDVKRGHCARFGCSMRRPSTPCGNGSSPRPW